MFYVLNSQVGFQISQMNGNYGGTWNEFLTHNNGSFLQSLEWGEFQKTVGRKVWRIKNDFFQALIIKYDLPLGKSYLYCPRGPVLANSKSQIANILRIFLKEIKEIVKKEGVIFLKIDPELPAGKESEEILREPGFKKSFKEIQPKKTLILDLTKPEEKLLAEMHQKTRYNIRVAERHGVKFSIFPDRSGIPSRISAFGGIRRRRDLRDPAAAGQFSNNSQIPNDQNFEEFWRLLQKTARRDKFRPHPREHYRKLLEFIPGANLFLAKYKDKVIAANIVVFFGKRAAYIHGASDFEYRNLMAPHLLHWQQILEAKKLGCLEYDFWGVDEKKWPGLTRFKKGFGGKIIEYAGDWDLVFNRMYYAAYRVGSYFSGAVRALYQII